ncbi:TPA: hypothetical protein P5S08_002463 [Salmonella enterica subsp. enterica serovar Concord]|nr:hypothetical protein [Salmonella enterica subsp. enterica serovar Concord]
MMLTEQMQQHKLLTGVWWSPLPSTTDPQRTRAVRGALERQWRAVTYEVTGDELPAGKRESREYRGLIERHSSAWEPLALYIRLLYGDGLYYARDAGGNIWLLIISGGVIVPGTDCLLSPLVFDALMEDLKFSQYKGLPVRELSADCAGDILTHYQANQLRLKKRRYFFYGVLVCLGLVLLAVPTVFILIG